MMNYAIIIAGGSGNRMGQDIPKQFINVNNRPILHYTLEAFQKHNMIDEIIVVCIEGWAEVVWAYAKQLGINKLKEVIPGGRSAQESIRNGVYSLESRAKADDIIVVHDGIRPLVDSYVLENVITIALQKGNAITSTPFKEQMFEVGENHELTIKYIPRETLRCVSTPQAYRFDLLDDKYHEAFEKQIGIFGSSYTNTMMIELGVTLNFAAGSEWNIKLTNKDDLELFKAFLKSKESLR